MSYLFTLPTLSDNLSEPAQIAIQMSALVSAQTQTLRTRVRHVDGRPENIAEHSYMLAKVAPELAAVLYPSLDTNLVARYAALHDDVETYVGDTPTDMIADHDPLEKEKREQDGLAQLKREFAHLPTYCNLIEAYESQSVPEARFIRAVDKLMVLTIHFPNGAAVLLDHYTYETFLASEEQILARDAFKYGEFTAIMELRREIGKQLAEDFLPR